MIGLVLELWLLGGEDIWLFNFLLIDIDICESGFEGELAALIGFPVVVELGQYFGLLGGHVGLEVVDFLFGRMVLLFGGVLFGLSDGDAFPQDIVGLEFVHVGNEPVREGVLMIVLWFHQWR